MGANATKEQLNAQLNELDKQEIEVNLKLKELQMQLNNIIPEEEKIKVNEELTSEPEKIENIKKQNEQYLEECSANPRKFRKYNSDDEDESFDDDEEEEEEDIEEVNEEEEEEDVNKETQNEKVIDA